MATTASLQTIHPNTRYSSVDSMSLCKTLVLKSKNLLHNPHKPLFSVPSITYRTLSFSSSSSSSLPQLEEPEIEKNRNKKSLNHLFQEAVGLRPRTEETNLDSQSQSELAKKLWELEIEVRDIKKADEENKKVMKNEAEKPLNLRRLFSGKNGKAMEKKRNKEGGEILKELSPDMENFVSHLYQNGYFKEANFLKDGKLEFGCLNDSYSRDYIKFAGVNFGRDQQQIAKWLSGSDLKKVAFFGCPNLSNRTVFAAKELRYYFKIHENTVCGRCVLKHSCKHENQSVWKGTGLNLATVMRIVMAYAFEDVHSDLSVPDEIKASVSRLLNEILRLSRTTS